LRESAIRPKWSSCSLPMDARKDRLQFPVSALSIVARPLTSLAPLIWWAKPNKVFKKTKKQNKNN
jgi:hypothetical protein